TVLPIMNVKFDMFPDRDDRRLRLRYHVNDSYHVEKVEEAVDTIEEYLYANKERFEIESVYSFYTTGYGSSTIILTDEEDAKKSESDIGDEVLKDLPKIAIGNPSFERRSSSGDETISIELWGDSSELLADLSKDLEWRLAQIDGLRDVRSSAEAGEREVHIKVSQEQAQKHSFSAEQVGQVVAIALRGQNLRRFKTPDGEVEIKLRLQDSDRENLDQLKRLVMYNDRGRPIELATIADFKWRRGPQHISRKDRKTTMSVTAALDGEMTVKGAVKKIKMHLANYELPPGYSWSFGRRVQRENESAQILVVNLLLALVLIYFVMAALFESLVYPAAIWLSILFAGVGTFWFFWMTSTTFSMIAFIGVFVLIGIVVNNGIVLIDHINQLRAQGFSRNEAILKGAVERVRPILMTAGTTVLGLVPLSIGKTLIGGDGPPYFPMARAIMGGLMFSTIVTLFILPTIYVGLDNLNLWGRRVVRRATGKVA
ncbi:MAG: efflux RND transporter permease subunit, partial [bacterium]